MNSTLAQTEVQILASPSLTPSVCKFTLDRQLFAGGFVCPSAAKAEGSPLLQELFSLESVREVLVSESTLTVATHELRPDWKLLGKKVGEILRKHIRSGAELFPQDFLQRLDDVQRSGSFQLGAETSNSASALYTPSPEASTRLQTPEAEQIQTLLEEQINPAVASHGGRMTLVDYKDGHAFLKMEGGCQGCGQANVTLRQGVEKAIKQQLSFVKAVIDVTDHESGANPYFAKDA